MRLWLYGLTLAALGSGACYSAGGSDEAENTGGTAGTTSGGSASGGSSRGGSSSGGTTGRGGSSSGGSSAAAGTGSTGGTGGTNDIQCTGTDSVFAGIDKTCSSVDDCVLVNHTADCCGTILIMGINAGDQQTFNDAESYCSALLPLCGCAAQGTNLEDGTVMDFNDTNYGVECLDGQCRSAYTGESFSCLTATCTATQYCQIVSGGPAGSEATGSCYPLGGCTDCTCINAVGCQCAEAEGHITITCAAP
ncbi:MAG TPA: hypothetical protein VM686_30555 [Polyangiaceae bacterium]|nr:hypothetical protein [Polyangiaceae bacterium]